MANGSLESQISQNQPLCSYTEVQYSIFHDGGTGWQMESNISQNQPESATVQLHWGTVQYIPWWGYNVHHVKWNLTSSRICHCAVTLRYSSVYSMMGVHHGKWNLTSARISHCAVTLRYSTVYSMMGVQDGKWNLTSARISHCTVTLRYSTCQAWYQRLTADSTNLIL